jgi:hypothetical protein
VGTLNRIYRSYREQVAFYVIYIKEIHPTDGWQVEANERDGVLFQQHGSIAERVETGQACMLKTGCEIPALVDGMDDAVSRAYAGMPERLYLVDQEGRIAYKSGMGPMFFRPSEWEAAIHGMLATGDAVSGA